MDILHRVGIKSSSPADAFKALTARDGLAAWWTDDTQGEGEVVGGVLRFRFGAGGFDMKVVELERERSVRWQVIDGPSEWIGTTVNWDLRQEDEHTIISFKHAGWKEPVAFMNHCSTKWAVFLISLKAFLETGKGAPAPNDFKIDNWN